ncbi:MAG TPA: ricin-type beta-trefoil lectin domain protein [Intrasporangium sp.]|uniref:ricin-type beta-trefoil lectin domain protein n=1 Tax=Intrasporangium sp. TaxID=1925024 RepID=UPI002B45ADF4|nr:ricin-type beta-trefoil lectin domain protein [Intrasporangium sp.]HKX69431.1 ricin-type beta-trefoil lectin domain protein [Intrasporangium sp.]
MSSSRSRRSRREALTALIGSLALVLGFGMAAASAPAHADPAEAHAAADTSGHQAAHDHGSAHAADDPGRAHAEDDLVGVSVDELEKSADPKVGKRPATGPAASKAAAAELAGPEVSGTWGPILPAAVVPVFTALLPNGKILMWDSVGDAPTESFPDHTFTRAAVFDPATGTSTRIDVAGSNIFCAGFVQLADGRIFVAGGNKDSSLNGIRLTHIFDWNTMAWTRGPDMTGERWYPSVAALMDGQALIVGGGPTLAEIRRTDGSIGQLPGITAASGRVYPWIQSSPDTRVLYSGPDNSIRRFSWWGTGAQETALARDGIGRSYGSYATYGPGLTIVAGGGSQSVGGVNVPYASASIIDTRSGGLQVTAAASMLNRRRQHNMTLLADGSVLATGGMYETGDGLINLGKAVFAAERWDPATNTWTELASASVVRQYHATTLLLPDGRVLDGGGGICGSCHAQGYLEKNMQVFTPPYLYARDGSGNLATRPSVSLSQTTVALDGTFTVSSPDAARIAKVGLVRLGAPTHSQDQSQRYVPLSFTAGTGGLTVAAPANPAEAPPGYYMLFAVDSDGVPAIAPIIKVTSPERGSATSAGARNGSPAAVAYRDASRTGTQQPFEPGTWQTSRGSLGLIGNDMMSSIDVANGWQATICTDDLLVGCTDLGPGIHNALPAGYDNSVSSLRITPKDATNTAPVAVATATPTSGTAPLTVQFSGAGSSDPDGTLLTYAWDLDGDAAFDDSTSVSPSFTYLTAGTVTAALRVSDGQLTALDSVTVTVTPGAPTDPVGQIVGAGSGKCLDINPNKKDKTVVSVWTCSGSADQQWTLEGNGTIVNSLSHTCLSLRGGTLTSGTVVEVATCTGASVQQWTATQAGELRNVASARCLDVTGRRIGNGSTAVITNCVAGTHQIWRLPA